MIDGVSVYQTRLNMGRNTSKKNQKVNGADIKIDVVIPIPDTSRPCAHDRWHSYLKARLS